MTPSDEALLVEIAEAIRSHRPVPEIERHYPLEEAYALQHAVTKLRSPEGNGGIKVGVTTSAAQAFFDLDHALLGSLYDDGRLASGARIPYLQGRNLETEFAILIDADGRPKAIAPAMEIVFVSFSRKNDMSAANLVVSNLGADLFVVGDFLPWDSPHEDVMGTLSRDGEVISTASMNDALGGPSRALPWVWNEIQQRRYPIEDDTLIMMGACGAVIPAESGSYRAEFGAMGSLEFVIE